MKFDNYLREAVGNTAYWISPKGRVAEVTGDTHIGLVIKFPEKFGLTTDEIRGIYDKYGEKMGLEGKAREEIIKDLVNQGWIRVRKYRNAGYSVTISRLTKKVKDILFSWADKLINKGIGGSKETDKYSDVNILGIVDGFRKSLTIQDVADDRLFNEGEEFNPENEVLIVESIEDL